MAAADTVTVACKIPNGLQLRVFKTEDVEEAVLGGGTRTVKRATQVGDIVKIHGPASPFGVAPKAPIAGGYALTHNVPAEFFAEWMKQNADSDLVRNGLIFASAKPDTTTGWAKERESVRSGLEPIDPTKLPKGIEPASKAA
eukprot:gene23421-24867_t